VAETKTLSEFATSVWNHLPYDHGTCEAACPTAEDMLRAVGQALNEKGLKLVAADVADGRDNDPDLDSSCGP
jgi:hypothetical protein